MLYINVSLYVIKCLHFCNKYIYQQNITKTFCKLNFSNLFALAAPDAVGGGGGEEWPPLFGPGTHPLLRQPL